MKYEYCENTYMNKNNIFFLKNRLNLPKSLAMHLLHKCMDNLLKLCLLSIKIFTE